MPGNIRKHSSRIALACSVLLTTAAGTISPAVLAKQAPVVAPELAAEIAARAEQAKKDGVWTVQAGDHFYRIARAFFPDDRAAMEQFRERLIAENPHAFMNGKPALLIVGARIKLPQIALNAAPAVGAAMSPPQIASASVPAQGTPPAFAVAGLPQASERAASATTAAPTVPPPSPSSTVHAAKPATATANALTVTPVTSDERIPVPRRPAPVYVDQVIEGVSQDNEAAADAQQSANSLGRKSVSVGFSHARRDRSEGLSRDGALELRLTTETENYGDFRLDSQWVQFNPATQDLLPARRSFNATLYNTQLPIAEGWTADSALGVVRSLQPLWVMSSYRVVLPSTLLMGATTQWTSDRADVRLALGNAGRLAGIGILDFERTSGRLASLSSSVRLAPAWQAGGALVHFTDSLNVPDHTAATLALEYNPGPEFRARGHLLTNNGGRSGIWTDLEYNPNRWRHRAGAYTLDPDLAYADSRPQNDIRGAYLRSEYRKGFDIYVMGLESSQSNIKNDPARSGTSSNGGYASAALRLDRNTSVGAGVSLRQDRPRQGTGESRNVAIVNAYASHQFDVGLSRVDVSVNRTAAADGSTERVSSLQWTHDFPRWNQLGLAVQAGTTREQLLEGQVDRRSLGFSLRGPLFGNAFWDANMTLVDVTGDGQGERGYNSSIAIDWPISSSWSANLSWQRNELRPGADNLLNPFRRENTVLLNVRYDLTRGIPYPRAVGPGGRQGTGGISGVIFFDENGDGIRQPSERGAEGILVVLDGRYSVTTLRDGSYNFGAVTLGNHTVTVQLEKVPLPWGLADESPRSVNVRLRDDARVDIGLTRISP